MARFNVHTIPSAQTIWCKSFLNPEVMRSLRRPLTQPHPLGRYLRCRARVLAFEILLAKTIDTANEDQRPGVVAVAGFIAQHCSVVIVVARGGHEAKRVTRAWRFSPRLCLAP